VARPQAEGQPAILSSEPVAHDGSVHWTTCGLEQAMHHLAYEEERTAQCSVRDDRGRHSYEWLGRKKKERRRYEKEQHFKQA
jgi:hypothetical protein